VDEYYAFINEFPEGRFSKEVKRLYESVNKRLNQ